MLIDTTLSLTRNRNTSPGGKGSFTFGRKGHCRDVGTPWDQAGDMNTPGQCLEIDGWWQRCWWTPVQDGTLTHMATHLGRCHLLFTDGRISCSGRGGRDLTRETSVFLKELKSLHFYGPISLWLMEQPEILGFRVSESRVLSLSLGLCSCCFAVCKPFIPKSHVAILSQLSL